MDKKAWYRASVTLQKTHAEQVSSALSELYWPPPDAVGLFEKTEQCWRVDAWFASPPDKQALERFVGGFVADRPRFEIDAVPWEDWVALGQSGLHPIRAGRFIVHGSHDRALARNARWAIEIDAGQAFGTAHHGSTKGCLLALDRLAKRKCFTRVLDLGTGTGVLAIAAAKAWRARVVASDIDPVATQIARENARRNRVGGQVTVITANGLGSRSIWRHAPYDLVTANILARPLMAMAPRMVRVVGPGGIAVISGITRDQAARVAAAFTSAGFAWRRQIKINEWVTLVLRRRLAGRTLR